MVVSGKFCYEHYHRALIKGSAGDIGEPGCMAHVMSNDLCGRFCVGSMPAESGLSKRDTMHTSVVVEHTKLPLLSRLL